MPRAGTSLAKRKPPKGVARLRPEGVPYTLEIPKQKGHTHLSGYSLHGTSDALLPEGYTTEFVRTDTLPYGWSNTDFAVQVALAITRSNNLYGQLFNNAAVTWLGGSNNIITNTATLSISSFGTNLIKAYMSQP